MARLMGETAPDALSAFQVSSTAVLSQDVLLSDTVVVDATSANPVGCFPNPSRTDASGNFLVEALVLVRAQGSQDQLVYVQRADVETGWQAGALVGCTGAIEIVAGLSQSGRPMGFYTDGAQLYGITLNLSTSEWSPPSVIYGAPISNLGVAYDNVGNLVAYGKSADGNLVIAFESGGDYSAVKVEVDACLSGAQDFGVSLGTAGASGTWALGATTTGGDLVIYQGQVGASVAEANSKIALPDGIAAVAVHFGYWGVWGLVFMALGSDGVVYSVGGTAGAQPAATTLLSSGKITAVTGQVTMINEVEQITLYATDSNQCLSVLNSQAQPWVNGSPVWAPWIPLSGSIAQVVGDMSAADYPSLFTVDSITGELGLWVKDTQGTGRWRQNPILQSGTTAFEVVRYRAEFSVMTGGAPAANEQVSLSLAPGSSTTEVSICGKAYTLTSDGTPLSLTTDSLGKVTVAILVSQTLAAPVLALSAGGVQLGTCQVNGPVQSYLNGQTPLNPTNPGGALPVMDSSGSALMSAATASGQPLLSPQIKGQPSLVANASQAVIQLAGMKPGGTNPGTLGAVGFAFSLESGQPSFRMLHCPDELAAARSALSATFSLGGIWGDITGFADDVYQGIRAGVITIKNGLVNIADNIVTAALAVANQISHDVSTLVHLAVQGIEDIAHLVVGVFQALEVAVRDVIDWLKALFDFAAIWRTKVAFESAVTQGMPILYASLGSAKGTLDNWFAKQEAAVLAAFQNLGEELGGSSISALPHFFQPGTPPGPSVPVTGSTNTGDAVNNVHHNWLQDKVYASGPPVLGDAPFPNLDAALQSFISSLEAVDSSFVSSFERFASWLESQIQEASSFSDLAISALLGAVQLLVVDLLELMDSLVDDLIELIQAAITALQSLLTQEIDLGPINTLWSWIASAAGNPGDKLSILSLAALLIAFPTTLFYKLANGVDAEPFPNGAPWRSTTAMQLHGKGRVGPGIAVEISDQRGSVTNIVMEAGLFCEIMGALPKMMIDLAGTEALPPKFYYIWSSVSSLISFACTTGLPTEEALPGWVKENPQRAAGAFVFAIDGALMMLTIYKGLNYARRRQLMGIVGVAELVFNIYELAEGQDKERNWVEIATGVVDPIPKIINGCVPNGFAEAGLPLGLLAVVNAMIYFFNPIVELADVSA